MKPVHPLVVHFPIALLALSVTADVIAFFAGSDSLRSTGWWSLVGAGLGGALAVLAGLFDMRRADLGEHVHERVHRHMKVGVGLLTAILGLTFWRWTIYKQPGHSVSATYLDCAILTMALAGFQGWLGGELVFSHGVFVERAVPTAGANGEGEPEDQKRHDH